MSLDLLKAVREAAVAGVHAAEDLFGKHHVVATDVSAEIAALADKFKTLITQVEQTVASFEAEAAKAAKPTLDDLKALVAKL